MCGAFARDDPMTQRADGRPAGDDRAHGDREPGQRQRHA
jgi:hypothetical protein